MVFGFFNKFKNVGILGFDIISPGDMLLLIIWENVDKFLFGLEGQVVVVFEQVQVDGFGYIFVFYVGCICVVGNMLEVVCCIICGKFED